jgi:hypothetical protein
MRTNNSKVKNTIISVYFILIVLAIVFAVVFNLFSDLTLNSTVTFVVISCVFVLLFFLVHYISKFFEYDSDGIKVVVTNSGLLLSDNFNYREKILEFKKSDLYAYKFKNYLILRTLTFFVKDGRDKKRNETFNITLMSRKKRRYIRQSLSKMVKLNKNSQSINE